MLIMSRQQSGQESQEAVASTRYKTVILLLNTLLWEDTNMPPTMKPQCADSVFFFSLSKDFISFPDSWGEEATATVPAVLAALRFNL